MTKTKKQFEFIFMKMFSFGLPLSQVYCEKVVLHSFVSSFYITDLQPMTGSRKFAYIIYCVCTLLQPISFVSLKIFVKDVA